MSNEKLYSQTLDIFDIERFAVHDGPGIRTTVFLQGCPLQCPWCANPESQTRGPKLMVFPTRCVGCGGCVAVCPHGAVHMADSGPVFNRRKCRVCGICASVCPAGALEISGKTLAVGDVMRTLEKDALYYQKSGGGITVSGGEPFVQAEGLLALLDACKKQGWHTALETTGQTPEATFAAAMGFVDLYLFDLKHSDGQKLAGAAKGDLPLILRNLKAAVQKGKQIILRVPVVPGFNHSEGALEGIFDLALEYGVENINLLPYHTLGNAKYERLGLPCPMANTPMLKKEELAPYADRGRKKGLRVRLGG